MTEESVEQTLARLRAEHVPCEHDYDPYQMCRKCGVWRNIGELRDQIARLLEHIEGLQKMLEWATDELNGWRPPVRHDPQPTPADIRAQLRDRLKLTRESPS